MAPFTSNQERDAALAVPNEFVANNRADHRYPRRGDVVANTVRVRLPIGAPYATILRRHLVANRSLRQAGWGQA